MCVNNFTQSRHTDRKILAIGVTTGLHTDRHV